MPRDWRRRADGASTPSTPTPPHPTRPLPDEISSEAERYVMSNHAIERCEERGIGIMEAYAAISEPDKMPSADAGKLIYVRGDLKVVVALKGHHILTVADRNADWRVKEQIPRQPVNPLIDRGRRSMPRKANGGSFDLAWILAAHTEPDMRKLL